MTDQIYKGMHDVYLQACKWLLRPSTRLLSVNSRVHTHTVLGCIRGFEESARDVTENVRALWEREENIHLHHRSQLFSVNAWHWFISRCREISRIRINIELFVLQTSGNQIKSQMKEIKGKVSIFYTSCLLIYL